MTNFAITIISDPVCPWCYIGKRRLDKAISLYRKVYPGGRHDTFTIDWEAFYLDPSAPVPGISWAERSAQRFNVDLNKTEASASGGENGPELIARLRDRLAGIARAEGLSFSFAGKIGNTRSAHRAIAFAKAAAKTQRTAPPPAREDEGEEQRDVQDAFVMALFAAYFEGDIDITSHGDLARVAAGVDGLDEKAMLEWLESGKGGDEVDAEARRAADAGLTGVPFFTVQGQPVNGAQSEQEFIEMFVKIKGEAAGSATS